MVQRVCLVSGGSGGHLLPALSLARALRATGRDAMLVTEGRETERALLVGSGIDAREVAMGGGMVMPFRLARAMLQARRVLRDEGVDLVVGTGGRASVPVALAARTLGIRVCLMEQNAVPGRANRLLAHLASRIWLGLPTTRPLPRALVTGTPLRHGLGVPERARARAELGLDRERPVLLVFGGSQGAAVLNETVPAALATIQTPVQVVHLSGTGRDEPVRRAYAEARGEVRALVRPLANDMATLYAAADLVICRGGGSTIAELMAVGRGALIVPYPFHRDRHQWHNGKVLERAGAAVVVEQTRFDASTLTGILTRLLGTPAELRTMGERARGLVPGDACTKILEDLVSLETTA